MPTPPPPASDVRKLFQGGRHDIHELLDVEVVEAGPERVVLRLPVTPKVHQPYGILHGGVSALLAESAASFGGALAAGEDHNVVGIELNASHLRAVRAGNITAVATPIRVGRTVQVWSITVSDDQDRPVCAARCTLSVRAAQDGGATDMGAPDPAE